MQFTKLTLGSLLVLAGMGGSLALNHLHGQPPPELPPVRPPAELPPTSIGPAPKAIVPAAATRPQPEPSARKAAPFDRFRKYGTTWHSVS